MIVYYDLKQIFLHLPKTGGTSVERKIPKQYRPEIFGKVEVYGVHDSLMTLSKKRPELNFSDFNAFLFTRNTWSRCASFFLDSTTKQRNRGEIIDPVKFYKKRNRIPLVFDMLTYQGRIHSNITYYYFEDYENEYKRLFKEKFNYNFSEEIPKIDMKPFRKNLMNEILSNDSFINFIGENGKTEIEFFKYTPPVLNN
jgi:hypothetical protein